MTYVRQSIADAVVQHGRRASGEVDRAARAVMRGDWEASREALEAAQRHLRRALGEVPR